MNIDSAEEILDEILSCSNKALRNDCLELLIRYARIRTDWSRLSAQERKEKDSARTRLHNSFIDSLNIVSRNMMKVGESNHWRSELGDDRKAIGDFACLAHAILGLRHR